MEDKDSTTVVDEHMELLKVDQPFHGGKDGIGVEFGKILVVARREVECPRQFSQLGLLIDSFSQ